MRKNIKTRKTIVTGVCATLSFLMVFNLTKGLTKIRVNGLASSVSTPERREEGNDTAISYVSDLIIEHDERAEVAKNKIRNAGYTVYEQDLNCNTGEDFVYLGYKTSPNEIDAIRKISLMDEEGGYSPFDYNEFVEKQAVGIDKNVSEFKAALADLNNKINGQSEAAMAALSAMNVFCIPAKSTLSYGPSLGDYLINPARTDSQLKEFLLHANTIAVSNVYEHIALGTIDSSSSTSWITKLVSDINENKEYLDGQGEISDFVSSNELLIDIVKNNISTYFDNYDDAIEKYNTKGEITSSINDADPWDPSSEAYKEFRNDLKNNNENQEDDIVSTISIFEFLKSFELTGESNLAVWFRNLGTAQDEDLYQRLAVLFNNLSAGQLISLKGLGLKTFCAYSSLCFEASGQGLNNEQQEFLNECKTSGSLTKTIEVLNQKKNEVLEVNDGNQVSVWAGTNKDLLELNTAITTEALRSNAAANEFDNLTAKNDLNERCKEVLLMMGYCAALSACLAVISFAVGTLVFKCGVSGVLCLGIGTMMGVVSSTVCTVCFSIVGIVATAITILIVAAAIICALVLLVSYLCDLWDYYHPTYSEIPDVMIDRQLVNDKSVYSTYYVVNDTNNEPADINAFQGAKWNALYYTKDADIGSPLTIDSLGKCFAISHGQLESKEGYSQVCKFGQVTGTNLNKDTYDDEQEKSVYLYYHTVGNQTQQVITQGKYIESVNIKSEETFKAAEDALKKEGYLTIDHNLSPDSDYATAIGFKLTSSKDQAITDIRLGIQSNANPFYFGSSSHSYGQSGDLTTTVSGEATDSPIKLYYSKSSDVGEPILSDINGDGQIEGFGIVSTLSNIPEGKEGINFFSGGKAYDFNFFNEQGKSDWGNHTYVYFTPEKQYTSSNSELYVGGIGCFSGSDDYSSSYPISKYAQDMGFDTYRNKKTGLADYFDITKGVMNDEEDDVTYLLPSYTYNPKRAISAIGTFTGEPESSYLLENIVSSGAGYSSIPCFTQGDLGYYDSTWYEGRWRTLRDSHCYITKIDSEGETDFEDNIVCPRALYVAGPTSGKSPLKANDLYVTNNKTDLPTTSGWNSVHELKNHYYDTYTSEGKLTKSSINLACSTENEFYMYLKGDKVEKGKYVSLISASSNNTESNSYNQVLLSLLFDGCEEIIEDNMSSNGQSWKNVNGNISMGEDIYEDYYEDYNDEHVTSFVGLAYTNKKSSALGSIKTYYVENNEQPSKNMTMPVSKDGSNASYTKCGDKITDAYGNSFYLYSSTSGTKISSVDLGRAISPWSAYVNPTDEFIDEYKNTVVFTALDQNNQLKTNRYNYFYCYTNESLDYILDLTYEISSPNDQETVARLIENGACNIQVYEAGNGRWLYVGISKTSSTLSAIKDIKVLSTPTSGVELSETITINGRTYYRLSETPINQGVSNRDSNYYLYATTGVKADKSYAINDFYLSSDMDISNHEVATTLDKKEVNVFKGLINNPNYIVYSHKNSGTWGMYGPTSASIFNDNPSLILAFGCIAILGLAGAGIALTYKKRKEA